VTGRSGDAAAIGLVTLLGAAAGWLYSGSPAFSVGGGMAGLAVVAAALALQVRRLIILAVAVGGAVGALAGKSIAHVLCLPDECVGLETVAAAVTAIGAMVGVGLVVALTATSLDEYRQAGVAGKPPPGAGCEADDGEEQP
jgi:hypothetical protein